MRLRPALTLLTYQTPELPLTVLTREEPDVPAPAVSSPTLSRPEPVPPSSIRPSSVVVTSSPVPQASTTQVTPPITVSGSVPQARPGVPVHSRDLLAAAARELLAAADSLEDTEIRYARAHLAALRTAAAVLAARARPGSRSRRSGGVRSAWVLLAEVAPELGEWATFFAAGAGKRAAAEAGLRGVVTGREADDLVREVESFLALVARVLGVAHQPVLREETDPDVDLQATVAVATRHAS
jgi:hypothetical protein